MNLYQYVGGMPTILVDPTGLKGIADGLCDKCCTDPQSNAECKAQAKKLKQALKDLYKDNYGKGLNESKHNQGGYLCWDWAVAFDEIGVRACGREGKIWWHRVFEMRPVDPDSTLVHFFTRFCACPNGKKECCVDLDDGFLRVGVWCHPAGELEKTPGWELHPHPTIPWRRLQPMRIRID